MKRFNPQRAIAPVALVVLYVFFSFAGRNFFKLENLRQILQSCYYTGFMAFGVTFVIITGGIDLSLGTNMMCSALLGAWAYSFQGWPLWLALILALAVGTIIGMCNGVLIAKLKLPPFIATLGMQMIARSFGSIVTNGRAASYPTFNASDAWFRNVFFQTGSGLPSGALWLLGAFLLAWFLLSKTRFGRYTYAIGSNEEATRISGVRVDRWKIAVYAICGLFAALGGLFYGAAYSNITAGRGNGEEMNGIAAVIIGGTSMAGGSGSVFGTLVGVLLIAVLKRGLISIGLQEYWQTFFTGIVIISAVLLDFSRNGAERKPSGGRM